MAYKGDTIKYRIISPTGTWRTVASLPEAEAEAHRMITEYKMAWVAVDKIETTRVLHLLGTTS